MSDSPHRFVGRLARVFPRRTNATPTDELAFVGDPPFYAQADEVHVSVTFTWDLPEAERLAKAWQQVAPVKIGGPATGMRGEDFEPGKYMKTGYVITSRGCRNKCWFCSVWKRDGTLRELPIKDGWILNDDNILACSEPHIRAVFAMLKRQPKRPQFVGGIEAALLKPWHVELLAELKPTQLFCAYDTPEDYEPLVAAGKLLTEAGLKNALRCYVLIGWPKDTMEAAEVRLRQTWAAGFLPFAMLWKNEKGAIQNDNWRRFQKLWCRPAITRSLCKNLKPKQPPETDQLRLSRRKHDDQKE
jgi:hypothetical protein